MQASTVHVNVVPGGMPVVLHISQYDVGLREYVFTLYSTQGTWSAVAGATATLEATKPDGHAVIQNCTYNNDGTITYTLQDQLAAKVGRVWSKLVLRDTSSNAIATVAIMWIVDEAGVTDSAIVSDSDLSALQEFIAEFGTINAYKADLDSLRALATGVNVAATKAAMTDHSIAYIYTGSESGMVTNNWYWYNGSDWVSGGAWQASIETDTTLTTSGKAADAKATGDQITELKSEILPVMKTDNIVDLYDSSKWKQGDFNNTQAYKVTQFYEINGRWTTGDQLYIGGKGWDSGSTYVFYAKFLNSSDALVAQGAIYLTNGEWSYNYLTVPANSAKIAIVVNTNKGSTAITPSGIVSTNPKLYLGETQIRSEADFYRMYQAVTPDKTVGKYIVVDKTGGGNYQTLKQGIEAAVLPDSTVYVNPGTYDLITEFGADYFNSFTEDTDSHQGLQLGDGIHVIFSAGAKVTANYTGNNNYVKSRFSPFNLKINSKGFTIEGLDLECSNVRYGVHDEDTTSATPYNNVYKRCKIVVDNSNNNVWGSKQCIGGGLGKSGVIEISDCYFESVGVTDANWLVSYHNGNSGVSDTVINKLYIHDNYVKKGTIKLSWYGSHTTMSTGYVSNNSVTSTPLVQAENASSTVENMALIAWNNEVRTS